jgi:dihydrofolate reductase
MVSTPTGGLGMNEHLPWFQLGVHTENFSEVAKGNIVLVGSSAFNNLNYLRGDVTYVYSQSDNFQESETLKRIEGIPEAVINKLKADHPDKNIIIAGGLSVFEKFYEYIDEWRVTLVEEFVVFNKFINLTDIQHKWPKHRLISSGQDLNQNFSTFQYSK